ncbi:MAG: hypothetical protein M0P31_06195 [Solirubrobacteraceae bacterium]|nr:hypothetical protein [Solirubrobacteraceae bacterium]
MLTTRTRTASRSLALPVLVAASLGLAACGEDKVVTVTATDGSAPPPATTTTASVPSTVPTTPTTTPSTPSDPPPSPTPTTPTVATTTGPGDPPPSPTPTTPTTPRTTPTTPTRTVSAATRRKNALRNSASATTRRFFNAVRGRDINGVCKLLSTGNANKFGGRSSCSQGRYITDSAVAKVPKNNYKLKVTTLLSNRDKRATSLATRPGARYVVRLARQGGAWRVVNFGRIGK